MKRQYWLTATLLAGALALGAVSLAWYNDRAVANVSISGRTINALSEESKRNLIMFMRSEENILAVQVAKADLVKNQRRSIFFLSDEVEIQSAWDAYMENRPPPPPLFGMHEDAKYNDRVANLFNGVAFDCRLYQNTLNFVAIPQVNDITPWICSTPVPPGYDGDFVGFISFFMKKEPLGKERERLAERALELAADIYKRDLK